MILVLSDLWRDFPLPSHLSRRMRGPRRCVNSPGSGRHLTRGADVAQGIKDSTPACSVEGCERPMHGHGWCKMHHKRWWRTGDPAHELPTMEERFWAKVDKAGPVPEFAPHLGPCWLWLGAPQATGYGQFKVAGWPFAAHRVSYELNVGPIPDGLGLDHLCRVTMCVNPAHLDPVTNWENCLRSPVSLSAANFRKTHCIHGHPFDEAGAEHPRDGARQPLVRDPGPTRRGDRRVAVVDQLRVHRHGRPGSGGARHPRTGRARVRVEGDHLMSTDPESPTGMSYMRDARCDSDKFVIPARGRSPMSGQNENQAVLTVPDCGICEAPMGVAPCPHMARVDGRAVCSEAMHDRLVDCYTGLALDGCGYHSRIGCDGTGEQYECCYPVYRLADSGRTDRP